MNVNQLKDSKFLKKEDCGAGILVTINRVEELNVAKEGAPQEFRWCLFVDEQEKPLVLNSTNGQIIAKICGSEESDDWTGHKIVLYNDPNVSFAGKITGGIRVRAPRTQPAAKPAATTAKPSTAQRQAQPRVVEEQTEAPEPGDEVPF